MRLFVALEIPEVRGQIAHTITEVLAQSTLAPMRAVDPALIHITLRFLGEVADEHVDELHAALAGHIAPMNVPLSLGPPMTFGPPPRASVISLRVDSDIEAVRASRTR